MNVRKKTETPTTLTVEWDDVTGQRGFETTRPDGTKYRKWTTTERSHKFAKKEDGTYLVDVFGNLDSGSYEQDSTPDPPPPAGQFGADLRAAFPPLVGLPLTDDTGKPPRTGGRIYLGSGDSNHHYKNVRRTGSGEGWKITSGAKNLRFDLCSAYDMAQENGYAMGWSFQPSSNAGTNGAENVQIYGGVNHNIASNTTSNMDHTTYFSSGAKNLLRAGVLDYDYAGYSCHGYTGYGGTTTNVVHANCTMVGSRIRSAVILTYGSGWHFFNCIIDGIDPWFSASDVLFDHCCITGNRPNGPTYTNCIYEDPDLDANFKPRNPKLLNGGLPGWVPEWDCRGNPYTKATIGAVVA